MANRENNDKEMYGTYGTPLTTIIHSAIPNWAGFTYQGLCAIHYALVLMHQNWDLVYTRKLNIEAYEDFAILDENDLIVSLHQCKEYNVAKDWTKECQKMSDKHEYWEEHQKISPDYDKMYFHANQKNSYGCGVKPYEYKTANKLCAPNQIIGLIDQEINEITREHGFPGSALEKRNKLISNVIQKVEELHAAQINAAKNIFDIAIQDSIPFLVIAEILKSDMITLSPIETVLTCRHYMTDYIKERLVDNFDVQGTKVVDFLETLKNLDVITLTQFVQRIFPDQNLNINNICVRSEERANVLYNVINEVVEDINRPELNWIKDGPTLFSPSTLGSDICSEKHCRNIVQNNYPGDVIRDYRWIVGDVTSKIDDVVDAARSITMHSDIDYTDITKPAKVGLLDIKSMNNEDY